MLDRFHVERLAADAVDEVRRSEQRRLKPVEAAGILAYLDMRMTNGPVEGVNNKLRVVARRAYGFHSPGTFISMLFLCCGGIELAPPLPTPI